MPYATLRYEVSDAGVATISLDQPETRNALSDELLDELTAAFETARDDAVVRCVVLTSTHERIFSAGANLGGFAGETTLVEKHLGTARFPRLFRVMGELGKPTICAANGHVLAGALGIALACDLVLARDGVRFGTPEINVGVFPFMIMALIYRNVPRKKTNELLLLGEQISAAEAERVGIVNRVFAPAEFEAGVREWAEKLAGKSPRADAAREGRDVPPAGHGIPRRARLPALAAHDRVVDRGHPGGRAGVLREARARMEGPMTTDAPTSLLRPLAEDLRERRERIKLGGGPEKIAAQHAKDKLTARERVELLIDPGTFVELGIHGRPHFSQRAMDGREAPADGVVTGYGKIDGRLAAVAAYDFTVMAGSMGMTGELKVARLRELALTKRIPLIWLLDSAGARIQEAVGSLFAGSGHLFREEVVNSGVIPQVAALMGPCAAGTAYIPGLADFVPMVRGRGSMALAGPHLVRAAVGEDVTQEELGGSRVHCRKSGVGDLEVESDEACIDAIKRYLSYFPQNCEQPPPITPTGDPIDRADDELLDVLPESNRKPYDMYEVISRIVDDGAYFDLKPQFAKTIITCLARFGGRPAGIVANQPKQLGGILDIDSADKAARFINLCNAYGLPLVYLMDVPGFMVGTKVEQAGIIRHGAKMLYATANATVPKVTVVLRKAYGAGYYVMCGRAYEPDLIVAWPSAEISVMGAEGAVEIIFRKQVQEAEDPVAKRAELIANFREIIDVYVAAGNDMIDDVIDPRETRQTICRALELSEGKRVQRPWKRNGVVPV